jgi:hypothetical protein
VIDGLIDPALVAKAEMEELGPGLALQPHRSRREFKSESPRVSGPAAEELLDHLSSQPFCDFLEQLTGIQGLIPDPSHLWAGINVGPPGSFQAVHADFQKHLAENWYNRVVVLLYLNSDWREDYGGMLELWPTDMTACGRRIHPVAGRLVIFETLPTHLHGVPDPVRCPDDRARLTLISRYYTTYPSPEARRQLTLKRPRRPQDPWTVGMPNLTDGIALARTALRTRVHKDRGSAVRKEPKQ